MSNDTQLSSRQPLDVNLASLRDSPTTSLKAFGHEWAAMCAGSALAEITRLQALVQSAPRYFSPHDFDGDKLKWLEAAGLA